MFRKLSLAAVVVSSLVASAQAQEFPGIGVGGMWANEVQFQNQFYNWAWQGSQEVAAQIPNDQPLPFNAMTIHAANNAATQAFEGHNNNWHQNSNATMNAIEGWDNGAIRQVAPYGDGYMLPYGPEAYHQDAPGYMYPGADPYGYNYYPNY